MDRIKLIQDHPRLRGEYLVFMVGTAIFTGSPPLARGVPLAIPYISNHFRITPACAGSTYDESNKRVPQGDHPRLRGEYLKPQKFLSMQLGSPPLARGVLNTIPTIARSGRITPACAGSTIYLPKAAQLNKDHPRLRGEYVIR